MNETIGEMTIDTLLDMRDFWRTEASRLRELAEKAEMEILHRLNAMGATVHASERFEAKIMPGAKSYTYWQERLADLRPLLRDGEWDKLVTQHTVTEVEKRYLNSLEKRGGEIAQIISEAVVTTGGIPTLKVTRLQEIGAP